ncbi:hypothetical protein ACOACO_14025 [Nocardioides sp. CPCC 205120]|uniref:hypothetical protein n=1 Tax=Nocardioides sp. CPCC 205120 TaxID=3406462 RepID=UPI003B502081
MTPTSPAGRTPLVALLVGVLALLLPAVLAAGATGGADGAGAVAVTLSLAALALLLGPRGGRLVLPRPARVHAASSYDGPPARGHVTDVGHHPLLPRAPQAA